MNLNSRIYNSIYKIQRTNLNSEFYNSVYKIHYKKYDTQNFHKIVYYLYVNYLWFLVIYKKFGFES